MCLHGKYNFTKDSLCMKSWHEQLGKTQIWTQCVETICVVKLVTITLRPVAFPVSIFLIDLHSMDSLLARRIHANASPVCFDLLRRPIELRLVSRTLGRLVSTRSGYEFTSKMTSPELTASSASFARRGYNEPTYTPCLQRKSISSGERLVPRAIGNFDGIWGKASVIKGDMEDFLQQWLFGQNQ